MKTKEMIALNGVNLDSLGDILLQSIDEGDTVVNVATASRFGVYGQHITQREKRSTDVTVKFLILESDLNKRAELLSRVRAWAEEGKRLTLSYRFGQMLNVVCTGLPAARDFRKRDAVFTAKFTAYNVPEWVDIEPTTTVINDAVSANKTLTMRATARTKLAFTVENTSGDTCDAVEVSTNGCVMRFEGIALESGQELVVNYVDDIMRATIGGVSVLGKRTPGSDDDVWIYHGSNNVSVRADVACTFTLSAVGRWV